MHKNKIQASKVPKGIGVAAIGTMGTKAPLTRQGKELVYQKPESIELLILIQGIGS